MTHDGHTYSSTGYRCHDFKASTTVPVENTLHAGSFFDVGWRLDARHPGDCSAYLSFENVDEPQIFFKIADFPGCVDQASLPGFDGLAPPADNQWRLQLPSWLPSTDHAVFRWEWNSVQQ